MSTITAHDPITPEACAEDIRNYGACEHGPAYPTIQTTSTWAVTRIAHPALRDVNDDCTECLALAGTAIDHARVTGSVGCTFGEVRGGVEHSATVARAITVVTR